MKLTYQLALDDIVAFNMYHIVRTKAYRKNLNILRIWLPIGFCILSIIEFMAGDISGVIISLAVAVLINQLFPVLSNYINRKKLRKHIAENLTDLFADPNTLEILEEGLLEVNRLGRTTYYYFRIGKIVVDGIRTYIYIGKGNAVILPNDRIPQEQIDEFVAELKVRIEASKDFSESPAPYGDS